MAKKEVALQTLAQYLPEGAYEFVAPYFAQYTIHLILTLERKTVLGNYRAPTHHHPFHRITVNSNLNPYSFLITLLHELAHMLTYLQYRHQVAPHGKEWKQHFKQILLPYIEKHFFPQDVTTALLNYVKSPTASTCTDIHLYRALMQFDKKEANEILVEDLEIGDFFRTDEGRIFEKIEQRRTRAKCRELQTQRLYLFPGVYLVKKHNTA